MQGSTKIETKNIGEDYVSRLLKQIVFRNFSSRRKELIKKFYRIFQAMQNIARQFRTNTIKLLMTPELAEKIQFINEMP